MANNEELWRQDREKLSLCCWTQTCKAYLIPCKQLSVSTLNWSLKLVHYKLRQWQVVWWQQHETNSEHSTRFAIQRRERGSKGCRFTEIKALTTCCKKYYPSTLSRVSEKVWSHHSFLLEGVSERNWPYFIVPPTTQGSLYDCNCVYLQILKGQFILIIVLQINASLWLETKKCIEIAFLPVHLSFLRSWWVKWARKFREDKGWSHLSVRLVDPHDCCRFLF